VRLGLSRDLHSCWRSRRSSVKRSPRMASGAISTGQPTRLGTAYSFTVAVLTAVPFRPGSRRSAGRPAARSTSSETVLVKVGHFLWRERSDALGILPGYSTGRLERGPGQGPARRFSACESSVEARRVRHGDLAGHPHVVVLHQDGCGHLWCLPVDANERLACLSALRCTACRARARSTAGGYREEQRRDEECCEKSHGSGWFQSVCSGSRKPLPACSRGDTHQHPPPRRRMLVLRRRAPGPT
jgi:hypothetical protein